MKSFLLVAYLVVVFSFSIIFFQPERDYVGGPLIFYAVITIFFFAHVRWYSDKVAWIILCVMMTSVVLVAVLVLNPWFGLQAALFATANNARFFGWTTLLFPAPFVIYRISEFFEQRKLFKNLKM